MNINNISYREGLAEDGLVRFVDSKGEAWLIPSDSLDWDNDNGSRQVFCLNNSRFYYAIPGRMDTSPCSEALDEYLESIKPELPKSLGSMIFVDEMSMSSEGDYPCGFYVRVDDSDLPWFSCGNAYWISDEDILKWWTVNIDALVDKECGP